MKLSKKLFSLLLVLVMVLSMIPMTVAAEEVAESEEKNHDYVVMVNARYYSDSKGTKNGHFYNIFLALAGDEPITLTPDTFDRYIKVGKSYYECIGYRIGKHQSEKITIPAYDGSAEWKAIWTHNLVAVYVPHHHQYKYTYNRTNHWMECRCGNTYGKYPHVDPAQDDDKICVCNYHFSNNADLSRLWLNNVRLSPRFSRDTTEYVGQIPAYLRNPVVKVSAKPLDAKAVMEMTGDPKSNEAINVLTFTITAEDKETTKTYTVKIYRPITVDGVSVCSAENTTTLTRKAEFVDKVNAVMNISEAALKEAAAQAEANDSALVIMESIFHYWRVTRAEFNVPGKALEALSQDLSLKCMLGEVKIPQAALAEIAKAGENITFAIEKADDQVTCAILADGEAVELPEGVTVTEN